MNILVTGGAGFIGSHFVSLVLKKLPQARVTVLDKLTYAGHLENLADVRRSSRFRFVKGDICDRAVVERVSRGCQATINFAAESFVDRSIQSSVPFVQTNIAGTAVLLDGARKFKHIRFLQVSTDEVYGSIARGSFTEKSPLAPRNPYAASKAAADLLALSYHTTHGLPVVITRSSNNFGPNQHPEKFIPLFITRALRDRALPLYGDGGNVRDWLYVEDNCLGILTVFQKGRPGEVYNIGGNTERANLAVAKKILTILRKPASLIRRVKDRPGHDRRYSLDSRKVGTLGFAPKPSFDANLEKTVRWYANNPRWVKVVAG